MWTVGHKYMQQQYTSLKKGVCPNLNNKLSLQLNSRKKKDKFYYIFIINLEGFFQE